mmetsp:Transcript_1467/g.2410  ORF Transcript_1467/g.2410 Transcript_1467/m.2410 type:complete len:194 (+) Transcript_1467:203-784(+)
MSVVVPPISRESSTSSLRDSLRASIVNPPTPIEWGPLRFLLMDSPKDATINSYVLECARYNVATIVRISSPSYDKEEMERAGVHVEEFQFPDGKMPSADIIDRWLALVSTTFNEPDANPPTIAVHCVNGLGRAPVLVAIALIEYGLDATSAIRIIRERRRGSINSPQQGFLETYKPGTLRKNKRSPDSSCVIM